MASSSAQGAMGERGIAYLRIVNAMNVVQYEGAMNLASWTTGEEFQVSMENIVCFAVSAHATITPPGRRSESYMREAMPCAPRSGWYVMGGAPWAGDPRNANTVTEETGIVTMRLKSQITWSRDAQGVGRNTPDEVANIPFRVDDWVTFVQNAKFVVAKYIPTDREYVDGLNSPEAPAPYSMRQAALGALQPAGGEVTAQQMITNLARDIAETAPAGGVDAFLRGRTDVSDESVQKAMWDGINGAGQGAARRLGGGGNQGGRG